MIATALGLALFGWSYAVACTSVYGVARAAWGRRRSAQKATSPGLAPSRGARRVLVIRPCAGNEPSLDRALASLATARSSDHLTCRFAIERADDPAARAAESAVATLREAGIDASVVVTSADAPNHKAAQIEAVVARESEPFDLLVVADSDVDLAAFELDRLLAPLSVAGSGAVWAPPVETGPVTGSGDRASRALLSGSLHAFTILGALDGGGLVGKLFALRRDAIGATGGFGAMKHLLGEDMELARLLRDAGRSVRVAPLVARSLKTGRSWQSAVDRYARWLTVIRAQRPHLLASYPLLFFPAPLILLASALLAPAAPPLALASAAVALAARWMVACAARALAGRPFSPLGSLTDAALADALLIHAFTRALASRTITWRGRTLTIGRSGALS